MSKDKYVCNLHATETQEEGRTRVFRLMVLADSYTEVEAFGFKYFEENLKEDYKNPVVTNIKIEKSNKEVDVLTEDELEDGSVDYATVFKMKVNIGFGEGDKVYGKTIFARASNIEDAMTLSVPKIKDDYAASIVDVLAVQATNLSPYSPIFDAEEDGV